MIIYQLENKFQMGKQHVVGRICWIWVVSNLLISESLMANKRWAPETEIYVENKNLCFYLFRPLPLYRPKTIRYPKDQLGLALPIFNIKLN